MWDSLNDIVYDKEGYDKGFFLMIKEAFLGLSSLSVSENLGKVLRGN